MTVADRGKAWLERELVIARTLNAQRELVFAAWTDPHRVAHWWGPVNYPLPIGQGKRRPSVGLEQRHRSN